MSFSLPLPGTFARAILDDMGMAYVVDLLHPAKVGELPEFGRAIRSIPRNFPKGAKSVLSLCLRMDDERWLIQVGPRGGWKKVWNFGTGRA